MEKFTIGYKVLFSIQVLHRYFLNFGNSAFDAPPIGDQKVVALLRKQYNMNLFWLIQPDTATREALKNYRLIFKVLPDGFRIGVETDTDNKPLIPFPMDWTLVFDVYPTDDFFMLYTDIDPLVMDELMHGKDETIKDENKKDKVVRMNKVFRLKNTGKTSETLNMNEDIPSVRVETYKNTDGISRENREGAQKRPLGCIEISHKPSAVTPIALLNDDGTVQENLVFTIKFRNRRTNWLFGEVDLGLKPLVANGVIEVTTVVKAIEKKLPNPTPATTFYKEDKFVSIIY
jgi:hypothetical protein